VKRIHQILFDFDYTLADSSEGIIASVNHALREVGEPLAHPAAIRKMIGHSLEDTFGQFIPPMDTNKILRCKKLFMDYADTGEMVRNTVLMSDVRETIEYLHENLFALGIVSTKRRSTIEDSLVKMELADFFDVVVGYEDVKNLKPDPEGLLKAMNDLAGEIDDTAYVGDSIIDIQAAKNAGLAIIAVASGMTDAETLTSHQPTMVIRKISELKDIFCSNSLV